MRLAVWPKSGPRRAIVIDEQARLGGRGAYVCARGRGVPARECLERALARGGIVRTLRCGPKIDLSESLRSECR